MIDIVEKASDIGFDNVPEFPEVKIELQIFDRLSGASVGSVSITGIYEIRFEYRCQYLGAGQLHQPVLQSWDIQSQ